MAEIEQVVKSNEKQRFMMNKDESSNEWMIRANQGHSLKTVGNIDFTPINSVEECPVVIHGTNTKAWEAILADGGLRPMGRTHIHCASGKIGDVGVISGIQTEFSKVCGFILIQFRHA